MGLAWVFALALEIHNAEKKPEFRATPKNPNKRSKNAYQWRELTSIFVALCRFQCLALRYRSKVLSVRNWSIAGSPFTRQNTRLYGKEAIEEADVQTGQGCNMSPKTVLILDSKLDHVPFGSSAALSFCEFQSPWSSCSPAPWHVTNSPGIRIMDELWNFKGLCVTKSYDRWLYLCCFQKKLYSISFSSKSVTHHGLLVCTTSVDFFKIC